MVYKVIGLMSGSSLDGLDIAYVHLEEVRGKWSFEIIKAECIAYDNYWLAKLSEASTLRASQYMQLHADYGNYIGEAVKNFISKYDLEHKVHFIVSHGHTVFHSPETKMTSQIGDGAAILAATNLPVISDLRAIDIALGGQGAPIVPIGDRLLFSGYDYLLNIGGIANLTIQTADKEPIAFDICPANQLLNRLAAKLGAKMDVDGKFAAYGKIIPSLLNQLNANEWYAIAPPKSLSNAKALDIATDALRSAEKAEDLLHTVSVHICEQVRNAIDKYGNIKKSTSLIITGGGAFNNFLVSELTNLLAPMSISIVTIPNEVIEYKEALIMALIGALRWREEPNVLSSVTGASKDSIGGAIWLP